MSVQNDVDPYQAPEISASDRSTLLATHPAVLDISTGCKMDKF